MKKIGKYTFISIILLAVITILFMVLRISELFKWYYIPSSASVISSILCICWIFEIIIVSWKLSSYIKMRHERNLEKGIVSIVTVVFGIILIVITIGITFSYNLGLTAKVEQYDNHIALYVTNTFVRTEYRQPHYMYEPNWLFMRSLNDKELENAISKYGDPENYYKNIN